MTTTQDQDHGQNDPMQEGNPFFEFIAKEMKDGGYLNDDQDLPFDFNKVEDMKPEDMLELLEYLARGGADLVVVQTLLGERIKQLDEEFEAIQKWVQTEQFQAALMAAKMEVSHQKTMQSIKATEIEIIITGIFAIGLISLWGMSIIKYVATIRARNKRRK